MDYLPAPLPTGRIRCFYDAHWTAHLRWCLAVPECVQDLKPYAVRDSAQNLKDPKFQFVTDTQT